MRANKELQWRLQASSSPETPNRRGIGGVRKWGTQQYRDIFETKVRRPSTLNVTAKLPGSCVSPRDGRSVTEFPAVRAWDNVRYLHAPGR